MEFEKEIFFNCPFCGEYISMIFELNYSVDNYIEDCEVCCRPIEISYDVDEGTIINLNISRS